MSVTDYIQFQGVPRRLLDRLLPSASLSSASVNETAKTGSVTVKKIPTPLPVPKPQEKLERSIVAPKPATSSLSSRVMAIIAQEAGVKPSDLLPDDDFANHGIDSLLSLTICGKIQEELGSDAPSSLFVDYPTPKELIAFFDSTSEMTESSSTSEAGSGTETPTDSCDSDVTSAPETGPSVLNVISQTIARETGVFLGEITPTTNFVDLGVDSLLALTIVGKLAETLGMEIPSSIFMENENLEEVGNALGIPEEPKVDLPLAPAFDPLAGPVSSSILLWGNPKTAQKIIFFFPDGSGSATSYATLPKLRSNTAAYGLNCPWMKSPEGLTCTLEELTAKYVVEIRRRQPKGPYYLGGWSAGGICAYEAAQQLARSSCQTERLILIDSPNPIGLENPPQRMYDFFESLGIFGTKGKAPPSWLRPHFDAFIRLLDNYKIQPLTGSIAVNTHLVYARDGICNSPDVPRPDIRPDDPREMIWLINNRTDFSGDGWASLVGRKNLHISVLNGVNHFSMMDPGPHMAEFSEFLQKSIL